MLTRLSSVNLGKLLRFLTGYERLVVPVFFLTFILAVDFELFLGEQANCSSQLS